MKNTRSYGIYILIGLLVLGGVAFFLFAGDGSGNRAFGPEAVLTTEVREGYSFQYPSEWQMEETDGVVRLDLPGGEDVQDPNPTDDIVFAIEDKFLEEFADHIKSDFSPDSFFVSDVTIDGHRGFSFTESGIIDAESYFIEIEPGLLLYVSAAEDSTELDEIIKTIRFTD